MARHQASRRLRNAILHRRAVGCAWSLTEGQFFFSQTLFTGRRLFFAVRCLEINATNQFCLQ